MLIAQLDITAIQMSDTQHVVVYRRQIVSREFMGAMFATSFSGALNDKHRPEPRLALHLTAPSPGATHPHAHFGHSPCSEWALDIKRSHVACWHPWLSERSFRGPARLGRHTAVAPFATAAVTTGQVHRRMQGERCHVSWPFCIAPKNGTCLA